MAERLSHRLQEALIGFQRGWRPEGETVDLLAVLQALHGNALRALPVPLRGELGHGQCLDAGVMDVAGGPVVEEEVPIPLSLFALHGQPADPLQPGLASLCLQGVAGVGADEVDRLAFGSASLGKVGEVVHAGVALVERDFRWADGFCRRQRDRRQREQQHHDHRSAVSHRRLRTGTLLSCPWSSAKSGGVLPRVRRPAGEGTCAPAANIIALLSCSAAPGSQGEHPAGSECCRPRPESVSGKAPLAIVGVKAKATRGRPRFRLRARLRLWQGASLHTLTPNGMRCRNEECQVWCDRSWLVR